jgi:hypothetical protein
MKTELTRLTVTIPVKQREALAEWADRRRMPVSILIRQLLDEYFGTTPEKP